MNAEGLLQLCKWTLYIGTALVAVSTIGVSYFSTIVGRVKELKIDDLLAGNRILQDGNKELLKKVETYQGDLQQKQQEIDALNVEAAKSRRGVVSTWDYNGARREGTAGDMHVTVGDEVNVFQQLVRLEQERRFGEIVGLATKQIAKTPEWLTPYMFRGVAYANIGEVAKATADLEHVVRAAPGDPNYRNAAATLQRLKH